MADQKLYRIGYQDHVLNRKFYRLELAFDKNCEYDTENYKDLKQVSKILIKKVSVNDNDEQTDEKLSFGVNSCFLYNPSSPDQKTGYTTDVSQIRDTYLFPAASDAEIKKIEELTGKKTVLLSQDGIAWLLDYESKNNLLQLNHAKFTYIYLTKNSRDSYTYNTDDECAYTYEIFPTTKTTQSYLDIFSPISSPVKFTVKTANPKNKLNNTIYGFIDHSFKKEVYCYDELTKFNDTALNQTKLSITPFIITNKLSKKVVFKGSSKEVRKIDFKEGTGDYNQIKDLTHFFVPNLETYKKPKDSTSQTLVGDNIYPSLISTSGNRVLTNWKYDDYRKEAGLFSFKSNETIIIIDIDYIKKITTFKEYKNDNNEGNLFDKKITIGGKTYNLCVDFAGYLIDDNGNRISTEEDNGLGPHHYPSQWTFSSTSNSTTSKTEVSETVEEMIEDAIEKNELKTPSEYYSSDTFFSTIEPGQDGYNKTKIIIDPEQEIKISSLKDIPTWFWLDTLKNWCTFKANNLADVFTGNELYVWNGRNGWLKFSRLIELWRKNQASIKETVKKLSLYDFDRMNLIFQESISPDDDGYADDERYYIDFKGIKLEKDCAYSNHDKETFETITSKIEYDKEAANSYRVTLFSGCPNIIRTGSNEICLCYTLEPNYSKMIMTHFFGKEKDIKYFSHRSRGSGTIRQFTQYADPKFFNEKICLQLFKEDFINSVCAASFGNGNDKTIEKDFHDFFAKKVDEEPSEFFASSSEASLVDAPEINNIKIDDAKLKIKFTANDLYSVGSDTTSTDFAERWN